MRLKYIILFFILAFLIPSCKTSGKSNSEFVDAKEILYKDSILLNVLAQPTDMEEYNCVWSFGSISQDEPYLLNGARDQVSRKLAGECNLSGESIVVLFHQKIMLYENLSSDDSSLVIKQFDDGLETLPLSQDFPFEGILLQYGKHNSTSTIFENMEYRYIWKNGALLSIINIVFEGPIEKKTALNLLRDVSLTVDKKIDMLTP